VRVKSYNEAVRLARSAGEDAANRRLRKAGRKAWSEADHEHAARVTNKLLADLGFDIEGWITLAGVPRNEPDEPIKPKKARRQRRPEPVQLAFAFG
jgi:hypothetical protein